MNKLRGGLDLERAEPMRSNRSKIIAMLDARRLCETEKVESRGKGVAKPKALTDEHLSILVR